MSGRRFNRMVVGLPQGMGDDSAVHAAANLAELLQIELLGTFIADASLRALSRLPMRELRTLELQWRPVDLAQISRDLDNAVDVARSRFTESVGNRAVKIGFDVITESHVMGSLLRADDIVAIIEPTHPGDTITQQFTGLLDTVFETPAAILVVPRRILRTKGPIMAISTSPKDASIPVALEIAAALGERLLIAIKSSGSLAPEILADAERLKVQVDQIAASGALVNAPAGALLSSRTQERLRVVCRDPQSAEARRLFSTLSGVPLLVVGPGQTELAQGRKSRTFVGAAEANEAPSGT